MAKPLKGKGRERLHGSEPLAYRNHCITAESYCGGNGGLSRVNLRETVGKLGDEMVMPKGFAKWYIQTSLP
jgi:hypothetical protein